MILNNKQENSRVLGITPEISVAFQDCNWASHYLYYKFPNMFTICLCKDDDLAWQTSTLGYIPVLKLWYTNTR